MFVAGAPDFDDNLDVNTEVGDTVRVVYAQVGNTKVLLCLSLEWVLSLCRVNFL